MPRIIIVSALCLWSMDNGKGAPSFFNTVNGYCNNGWDVYLMTPDTESAIQHSGLLVKEHKQLKIPFERQQGIRKIGYLFKRLSYISLKRQFTTYMNQILSNSDESTIIYAYEIAGVKAAKKISEKYKLPLVTRFQGTILDGIQNTMMNRIRHYPHIQALETRANAVIMTNDGTKGDQVLKYLNNQSDNIYFWRNGVNLGVTDGFDEENDIDDRIKKEDRVLLTVSRLEKWKHVERSIIAYSKLNDIIQSTTKLVIVGGGSELESLTAIALDLGLEDKVIFTGAIEHDKVAYYMKRADIFLSLYDLSNVGNPLMEAMLCKKAIITLDVGDTAAIITNEENGVILQLNMLDDIPIHITKLLSDTSYKNKLEKNAYSYAKQNFWTWDERIRKEILHVSKLL